MFQNMFPRYLVFGTPPGHHRGGIFLWWFPNSYGLSVAREERARIVDGKIVHYIATTWECFLDCRDKQWSWGLSDGLSWPRERMSESEVAGLLRAVRRRPNEKLARKRKHAARAR